LDIVVAIIGYESGTLTGEDEIKLFAELIRTGMAWTLQGCYGRTARHLIEEGVISSK